MCANHARVLMEEWVGQVSLLGAPAESGSFELSCVHPHKSHTVVASSSAVILTSDVRE